ncbi:MAG: ATP-binding cassette domain-containing protein [Bacteroidia bacterium]|nr:ATP-binding cassette domain-containing protein [Bacteroidia bacterium]
MNDIILSALLNLFALFGAEKGLDKTISLELLEDYLVRFFGIRNTKSYTRLYTDLREFYDDDPELDKDIIVAGICSKLKLRISPSEKITTLLRMMEFCSKQTEDFDPKERIFALVADNLEISGDVFEEMARFASGQEGGLVRVLRLDEEGDILKTLYFADLKLLIFSCKPVHSIWMDDIRVRDNVFQVWNQSSVLKSSHFEPVYHSTVLEHYIAAGQSGTVELCGRDINFRFDTGGDNGMHNLSFTLKSGELVAIMGGSGVGKSTLLSLLNGNLIPQSGSITVNGHDISEPDAKKMIGFVPQDDLLIEELTVYQNLWYTAKLCFEGMPEAEIDKRVISVLTQLGLDAAKDLKVGSPLQKYISGGQRKRLNIALELIREPAILYLDEPTSGLSSTDTEKVVNILKELTHKGKLIVVNIHQPSSDVYKLFDRLWLLDKGGYPVFDGNPIEAVSYFKGAANYADYRTSACPTCGNVNPEIVLNIIDEKAFDNSGRLSDKRKVSPQEWHELYLKNRPEMPEVTVGEVPPTDQKRPGSLKQTWIFLRRNLSAKLTNLQYILVTALEAPLLALICGLLTHYTSDSGVYTLLENKNFPTYIFMAIIVAIFLGMSGSAEEIIKDRALLKREKFLRLSYGSYIWSKIIYMAFVCLIQTLLFILVGNMIIGVHGLFWTWWLVLFVSAFLSALIGLLLSQSMSSVVAIYITIPLLLIPQILLCGLVVKFDDLSPNSKTGNVPVIGDVIPSRWAYEALAVANFTGNDYEKLFFEQDRGKYTSMYYVNGFLYELESQLESRNDEITRADKDENPAHIEFLRAQLPRLAEICGMEPYSGNEDYASLRRYLDAAGIVLKRQGNKTTLELDKAMSALIKENGKEEMMRLKRDSYNIQLENLVVNRDSEKLYVVRGTGILPRTGYAFLTPASRNGRAPFYSGVKVLGDTEISTLWYDVCVLLLMCVLVGICLFTDFPGRFVRQERN